MRRFFDFPVGTRLFIDGREHQLRAMIPSGKGGIDEPDDFNFVDCVLDRPVVMPLSQFQEFYDGGMIRFAIADRHPNDKPLVDHALEDSPDAQKRLIRLHYLTEYDANPVPLSTEKLKTFVVEASARLKIPHKVPSAGTMRRMLQRGSPGDRRTVVLGDRHRRGPGESRMHNLAQNAVEEKADLFWDNHRTSMMVVHCAVRTEIFRLNQERKTAGKLPIPAPSYSTVRRYLARHTDYDHYRRKFGARAAQRMFVPLKGSMHSSRILEKAIIDHTWLDCFVVDDRTMLDVGRPYLTVLIDAYSRYPLGFCLSFTPPSLQTAMQCVVMGIKSKSNMKDRYPDLEGEWLAFGRPETILSDNGWEFTGVSFQLACAEAGMSSEWAPVRAPEYKGPCERFFGTLRTQMINLLPGAIPLRREVLNELGVDTHGKPVFTLSQIEELICHFIVDDYSIGKHRTLRNSPANVWRKSERIHGIPLAKDIAALEKSFGSVVRNKTLRRDGIQHRGLLYRSDELFTVFSHNLRLGKKRGVSQRTVKVNIKEYPANVSIIGIFDPVTQEWVIVPCTQMRYAKGLTIHQHTKIQEFQAEKESTLISEDLRCMARERFRLKVLSLIPASSLSQRRRLQRDTITSIDVTALISSTAAEGGERSGRERVLIPTATMVTAEQSADPEKSALRGRRKSRRPPEKGEKIVGMPEDAQEPSATHLTHNPFAGIDFNKIVDEFRPTVRHDNMGASTVSTTMASRYASADDIFINYSFAREAHETFDFLIAHAERRGEKSKRCVLLVGPSQAGKSSIIESYVARLNTEELLANRRIPVLHVTLEANVTRKGLAESILEAIQDFGYGDVSTSGSETILLQRARRYMKMAGVKLLVLDEFHHVINSDSEKVAYSVGETIKRMLQKGVCAIVLVGVETARDPFLANAQLAQRAEPAIELRPLDVGSISDIELFSRFLGAYLLQIEKAGIVENAVNLLDAETVVKIFEISEGTLGRACNLVKAAIKLATRANRNYIIVDDLARAADRIYKGKCKGNPFARGLAPIAVA